MAYTIICRECSNEVTLTSRHKVCNKCRAEKAKKKCLDCDKMVQRSHKRCIQCHNKNMFANYEYKKVKHSKGYVMVKQEGYSKNNGYVMEHVLIIEKALGRKLLDGENVHHINGIKDDNRLENLELWTKAQPVGIRASDALTIAKEIIKRYDGFDFELSKYTISPLIKNNKSWKYYHNSYNKNGYIRCYWRDESGKIKASFQHVIFMERHLGRELLKHENVHHINGIKDDNRIENLELWTRPQPSGIRVSDAIQWASETIELYQKRETN